MAHRYQTRYQNKVAHNIPVPCYDENKLSDEEIRQRSLSHHHEQQETLFSSLVPYEMRQAVESILLDHYDEKIHLTEEERKEGEKIYRFIQELSTEQSKPRFMTLHYPIITRLESNIELFTFMKHNHVIVRRFPHLANTFHDYYSHFSVLYSSLWNRYMDPASAAYKDVYLPYCTLLSTLKDVIHTGELIFINENLLKYY